MWWEKWKLILLLPLLLIWEREKHWPVVPFIYAFIGWPFHVPWLGNKPATLVLQDDTPTNYPARASNPFLFLRQMLAWLWSSHRITEHLIKKPFNCVKSSALMSQKVNLRARRHSESLEVWKLGPAPLCLQSLCLCCCYCWQGPRWVHWCLLAEWGQLTWPHHWFPYLDFELQSTSSNSSYSQIIKRFYDLWIFCNLFLEFGAVNLGSYYQSYHLVVV